MKFAQIVLDAVSRFLVDLHQTVINYVLVLNL